MIMHKIPQKIYFKSSQFLLSGHFASQRPQKHDKNPRVFWLNIYPLTNFFLTFFFFRQSTNTHNHNFLNMSSTYQHARDYLSYLQYPIQSCFVYCVYCICVKTVLAYARNKDWDLKCRSCMNIISWLHYKTSYCILCLVFGRYGKMCY